MKLKQARFLGIYAKVARHAVWRVTAMPQQIIWGVERSEPSGGCEIGKCFF